MMQQWTSRAVLAATALSVLAPGTLAQSATEKASNAIEVLNSNWYNSDTGIWDNAWWNSANAFTTLAEFTLLRREQADQIGVRDVIWGSYQAAQQANVRTVKRWDPETGRITARYCINDSPGCVSKRDFVDKRGFPGFINEFYDDEGWWALGLISAFDISGKLDYIYSAMSIFEDMKTGLGGPCNGGIYWNKERKYVNAITNELYLAVAASLANRVSGGDYGQIAKDQWQWFRNSGMINDEGLINDGLNGECKNNGAATWSYNQGVILGGLVELSRLDSEGDYLNSASYIAKAAISKLGNENGVLIETDKCEGRDQNCGADGQQFKGVFMRNLAYLHAAAPDETFANFIASNAESIWTNNRDSSGRLGVAWAGPYIDATGPSHSSALDALVAAITIE